MLFTNVFIILNEEMFGPHASPRLPVVLLANAPWLLMPFVIIYRMWRYPHPFTEPMSHESRAQSFAVAEA
jgi:hypothetical protein